jgi:hypothetical protein
MKEEDKNIKNSPGFGFLNDMGQRNSIYDQEQRNRILDEETN